MEIFSDRLPADFLFSKRINRRFCYRFPFPCRRCLVDRTTGVNPTSRHIPTSRGLPGLDCARTAISSISFLFTVSEAEPMLSSLLGQPQLRFLNIYPTTYVDSDLFRNLFRTGLIQQETRNFFDRRSVPTQSGKY